MTGGKDGVVLMWDEAFQTILKTYQLEQSSVTTGGALLADHPAIRALALGKDCILVGTKNSEVDVVWAWLGHFNLVSICT